MQDRGSDEWRASVLALVELAHEIQVWRNGDVPSPPRCPPLLALVGNAGSSLASPGGPPWPQDSPA